MYSHHIKLYLFPKDCNILFIKMINSFSSKFFFASLPRWATVDPFTFSGKNPHTIKNILDGKAYQSNKTIPIVDPMNG